MRDTAAKTHRACDLCGLRVGEDRWLMRSRQRLFHFCCPGCRQAYVISRAIRDPEFPPAPPPVGEPHDA